MHPFGMSTRFANSRHDKERIENCYVYYEKDRLGDYVLSIVILSRRCSPTPASYSLCQKTG